MGRRRTGNPSEVDEVSVSVPSKHDVSSVDVGMAYFLGIEMVERPFDLRMGIDVRLGKLFGFRPLYHGIEVLRSIRMVVCQMTAHLVVRHFGHIAGFREFFDYGFVLREFQQHFRMETLPLHPLHDENVFHVGNIRIDFGNPDFPVRIPFLKGEEGFFMAPDFLRYRIDFPRIRDFHYLSFDLGMPDDDCVVTRPHYVGRFEVAQKFGMVTKKPVSTVDFVFRDVERKPPFHFGKISHGSTLGPETAGNWRRDFRCVSDGLSCGFQSFFHELPASSDCKSRSGNY